MAKFGSKLRGTIRSSKFRTTALIVLVVLLSIVCIGSLARLKKVDTTRDLGQGVFVWKVGTLDEADGDFEKASNAIVTRNYYGVNGLTLDLTEQAEENNDITYQLFYFDEDEEYISASDILEADADSTSLSIPETAKYFKVVIYPANDEKITLFEVNDYANMLLITIDK